MKRLIFACLLTGVTYADVETGYYKHPLHGGGTEYVAHITIEEERPDAGAEVTVLITVNGKTVETTAVAGEDGTISSMEPVKVEGGHTMKIVEGKSKPYSKKKGNAQYKKMHELEPAEGRASTKGIGPDGPVSLDGDEGVGSLPVGVPQAPRFDPGREALARHRRR